MRRTFIKSLVEAANEDENIFLLTPDLGYSVLEEFAEKFPNRFLNVGIAEQTTIGLAAGLALAGKQVFVYSIIPFLIMRPFEQIRNDLCYQNLNVRLIGVGAGITSYPSHGPTHQAIEDISIMRSLPNMTVIVPADPIETKLALKKILKHQGPVYLRLARKVEPIVHQESFDFQIGKAVKIMDGEDITLFVSGSILEVAKKVADKLKKEGISIRLISMHTIKPIDKEIIFDSAKKTKIMFSLEEHSVIGGLGTAIAEVLADFNEKYLLKVLALPDRFIREVGSADYLRDLNNLSEEKLTMKIKEEFLKMNANE